MPYMDQARLTDYRQPFTTERFFYLFINIIIIFYYTTNHMVVLGNGVTTNLVLWMGSLFSDIKKWHMLQSAVMTSDSCTTPVCLEMILKITSAALFLE